MRNLFITETITSFALIFSSVYAQKPEQGFPGGIQYLTVAQNGLPQTASFESRLSYANHRQAKASDYPYGLQLYDYLYYCWTPDTLTNSYTDYDEVLWNLPDFSFYDFHRPTYGVGSGAFIENDRLHTYVSDFSFDLPNYYRFELVTYNADNMQVINHKSFDATDLNNFCYAQCQYPLDEKKGIGIFYNSNGDDEDWVLIDYDQMTLTRMGHKADRNYGILVTDGTWLYGWGEDNCIYRIDPNTFKSTKVGAHGFTHYVDDGYGLKSAYVQSATYDKNTKTCIWGAFNAESAESGFYKVDLETAQIEKILDTYVAQHVGICTYPQSADDNAPGPVTDLEMHFDAPAHQGTATFTMPTLNYRADQALEGVLSYKFMQGSTTLAEAEGLQPGQNVTVDLSVAKDGNYTFTLQTSNEVGSSPKAFSRLYVGYDTPIAPASASLVIGNDGTSHLHWTAPQQGLHGGYVADLTYDVYRIQGTEMTLAAASLTDTTFTEHLSVSAQTTYQYAIVADDHSHQSDYCYSNGAACGNPYESPMVVEFTDKDVFNLFTPYDANADGYTWYWDDDRNYEGYACYRYNVLESGDDWLFSPEIHLEAGRTYKLSYRATCVTMSLPERLSIALGKEKTPEAMTQILENRRILPEVNRDKEITFTVNEDGEYHLGFYACSDMNELDLMLQGFRIDVVPLESTPAQVEEFSCIPGEKGATNATLTFKAPSTTVGGSPLTTISRIAIVRDLNEVKVWENVEPGQTLEYFDEVGSEGYHLWEVFAYNEQGCGENAEQRLYLGYDVPAQVTTGYVVDDETSLDIRWEPVTVGAHGGYIDPEEVTYEVRDYQHVVKGTTTDNHLTIDWEDTDTCNDDIIYFRIYSTNSKGHVDYGSTRFLNVGAIRELPFTDSAPNGVEQQHWWNECTDASYIMGVANDVMCDNDGGGFIWYCMTAGDNFDFNTAKLDFTKAYEPKLHFCCAAFDPNFTVTVNAWTPSHRCIEIGTFDFANVANATWTPVDMELPKELADERYATISFHLDGEVDDRYFLMDDVNIYDTGEEGIEAVRNESSKTGQFFDLSGRRLSTSAAQSKHNVLITDGHKVIYMK